MIAEEFEYFEEKYGKPTTFIPADPAVLSRLSAHLPEVLIEYWEKFGFSIFLDGYFQLVNPEDYQGVLDVWLEGTELEGTDEYSVISRTAFGELEVWGKRVGRDFVITPIMHAVLKEKNNQEKYIAKGQGNKWAESALFGVTYEEDAHSGQVFQTAKSTLGPLGPDQMYGIVPAIPLGGQFEAENLQVVSAPEHLHMLALIDKPPVLSFNDLVRRAYGDAGVNMVNKQL